VVEWVNTFERIYGNLDRIQSIEQICFHLTEEIGEVARELRLVRENHQKKKLKERVKKLQDELADVFDWLIALLLKISFIRGKKITLGRAILSHKGYFKQVKSVIEKVSSSNEA